MCPAPHHPVLTCPLPLVTTVGRYILGATLTTKLIEFVLGKTSLCASNVLVSNEPVAVGGADVTAIYVGAAPIDYGVGFTFTSYNGELICFAIADEATVPAPKAIVDHVQVALADYCAGEAA